MISYIIHCSIIQLFEKNIQVQQNVTMPSNAENIRNINVKTIIRKIKKEI